MTLADAHGNAVSTRSRAALDLYDRAAALFARFQIDPLAVIDAALQEDPSFVMGH